MLKFTILAFTGVFLFIDVNGQRKDSLMFYYQYDKISAHEVSTLDSADYFRVIILSEPGEKLYTAREYYKDGTLKLVGKFNPAKNYSLKSVRLGFLGEVVDYYPNGKKHHISHYSTSGYNIGDQYLFYPNGEIYYWLKNTIATANVVKSFDWECYNNKGTKICTDGNGYWINYDSEFKGIISSGPIKNGLREGEWHGHTETADSVRYTYIYHKYEIVSALGYDKSGKSYPFDAQNPAAAANYKGGPITFIKIFKNHLKIPKGEEESKRALDDNYISFIVEKDGQLTNLRVDGGVTPQMEQALNESLNNCQEWKPSTYYGIPLRTKVELPLKYIHGYTGSGVSDYYREELAFRETILSD